MEQDSGFPAPPVPGAPAPLDLHPAAGPSRRSRRLGTTIGAFALIVLGLFGAGTATGWWGHRHWQSTRPAQVSTAETDTRPFLDADSTAVPDVRGLTEAVARQILADAGVSGEQLTVDSRPFAGLVGVVVEQDPPFGTADPGAVRLTVSVPAAVPAAADRDESAVVSELRELGTQVAIVRHYQPGAAAGTVLQVDPPSGAPLPETVTVTVAADPATAYLANVQATENRCATGEYTLAGREEQNALSCSVAEADARSPRGPVWEFNRAVEDVELTVGLPTDAEPGSRVKLIATADGRVLQESTVEYGATVTMNLNTRDALQFSLLAVGDGGDPEEVTVAGVVRGDRDAIVALTEDR